MSSDFVHLHLHTQYSLLDGANRTKELIRHVLKNGMTSMAVTDHGNMFGAFEIQSEAIEHGLKPILGVEAYIAPGSRLDREAVKTVDGEGRNYHLTLLAETPEGYRNLSYLVSEAFLTGFYYKPRMDWELLEKHHAGLVALSGCVKSEVSQRLLAGDFAGAKETAVRYQTLFGKDRYFIELMDHGLPVQRQLMPELLRLSRETGIPVVATNDAHYLQRDDAEAQDVLLCIGMGKTVNDAKRMKFYNSEFYVKNPGEMTETFRPWSLEAVKNSVAIADRVAPKVIVDTSFKLPTFPLPEEAGGPDEYLEKLAGEGLEKRLAPIAELLAAGRTKHPRKAYDDRLAWELSVIKKMGLSAYFLIVWDFIKFAKDDGIPVGPGRGSAAGSLVAWTLGITEVDPLRYDLLFERFLNPDRISMPDIDVDLCERRRGEVIEYVRKKYGKDNVGQIITFNSMKARAVIRDVGRALDVPLAEVNKLCAMIPANPGKPVTLAEARHSVKELADALAGNESYRKLFDLGERLEGVSRHAGVHAAGVLIAPRPLVEYLPLYKNNNDEITTQFEMKSVDKMGLLKMDFLGLITLTILDDAVKSAGKRTGQKVDLAAIPLNDPEVFRLFSEGRTDGIFQFESSGMRDLLRRVQPSVFSDLAALNALYRPGALDAGTVEVYIERRRGKKFEYPLPAARAPPDRDARRPRLPGAGDARRAGHRRLHPRRGGQAPQGDRQEGRGGPEGRGREVRQEVGGERRPEEEGRGALGADPPLRPLRVQQVALGRLRPPRVPDRVDEGPLPGGLHGRDADGGLGKVRGRREVRQRLPGDEDPGPPARREHVRSSPSLPTARPSVSASAPSRESAKGR